MFNKLKQFKELRNQAKVIQNALAEEKVVIEKKGVRIEIDGNFQIKSLTINGELSKEKLEEVLTDCFNDAIKKVQRVAAVKIQQLGGLPGFGA